MFLQIVRCLQVTYTLLCGSPESGRWMGQNSPTDLLFGACLADIWLPLTKEILKLYRFMPNH